MNKKNITGYALLAIPFSILLAADIIFHGWTDILICAAVLGLAVMVVAGIVLVTEN